MIKTPTISELIHHIKRCPQEFLSPPVKDDKGEVHTEALVNDIFRMLSGELTAPKHVGVNARACSLAELRLINISCWVLTHPFFKTIDHQWINDAFYAKLRPVASLVKSELWVNDEERAEELARMILQCCGYIPGGETREEALDRFESVNTVNRLKVIEESNAANERAKEIRKKMAEKKAREAANVYGRE